MILTRSMVQDLYWATDGYSAGPAIPWNPKVSSLQTQRPAIRC